VGSGSRYPAPFDAPCKARSWLRLGDAAGLTQFGVNMVRLPAGAWSSQRHWHALEDEFVFVLEGEVVLVTDAGEERLGAGECAGFKAGVRDGHCLQNRSSADAVLLVVGTRDDADWGEYSDIDMVYTAGRYSGHLQFLHRDGTRYEAPATPNAPSGVAIDDPISRTARWIAAARARESRRPDRLFDDPFAEALAGPEGFAQMHRLEAVSRPPGMTGSTDNPYLSIRTRFLDDFLASAVVPGGAVQVVIVAAGLDTRAYRRAWPEGTRLFELDRPELLAAKQQVLDRLGARPRCDRRTAGVDFTAPTWGDALIGAGFDATRPAVWIVEGLLPYLDAPAVHQIIARTASLAAPGSRLAADVVGRSFLESPWTQAFRDAVAQDGAPWRFGTEEPEALFGEGGWHATATRPGDPGANFGRWPFPVVPRGMPGIPSTYLVVADR
jgi:methyltransferase (TIGR00027 family)